MPVYKRKNRSGKVVWRYQFTLGATREKQELFSKSGFATKQEAIAAEATRRAEEQVRRAATGGVAAPHADDPGDAPGGVHEAVREEHLAPKTIERYHEMRAYLSPELLAMNMTEITPLHLQPRVGAVAEVGRPHPQDQDAAPDEAEDGKEHRRIRVLCVCARH